jgi:hypothetical protein
MTDSDGNSRIADLEKRVALLERQVDQLLRETKPATAPLDVEGAIMAKVRALVDESRVLEAIDLYREHYHVGPAEAKAFVEALPKSAP